MHHVRMQCKPPASLFVNPVMILKSIDLFSPPTPPRPPNHSLLSALNPFIIFPREKMQPSSEMYHRSFLAHIVIRPRETHSLDERCPEGSPLMERLGEVPRQCPRRNAHLTSNRTLDTLTSTAL